MNKPKSYKKINLPLTRRSSSSCYEYSTTPLYKLNVMEGLVVKKIDIDGEGRRSKIRSWSVNWMILKGSRLLCYHGEIDLMVFLFIYFFFFQNMLSKVCQKQKQNKNNNKNKNKNKKENEISIQNLEIELIISLKNSLAFQEESYTKRQFVFRLITGSAQSILFQAPSISEMNRWIFAINHQASRCTFVGFDNGLLSKVVLYYLFYYNFISISISILFYLL